MQKLMQETAQIGNSLKNNSKDADDDGILFEGVHDIIRRINDKNVTFYAVYLS
jgi:hypothetical protein